MAHPHDTTKLAGLTQDGMKAICKRRFADGVVCDGRIGKIPDQWFILHNGRFLLGRELAPPGATTSVEWSPQSACCFSWTAWSKIYRMGGRSPRRYPAWAECPKCGDIRVLDRHALVVVKRQRMWRR